MKTFDRIILSVIAVGIWTSVFMFNVSSRDAYAHESVWAGDVWGFGGYIKEVIQEGRGNFYISTSNISGLKKYIEKVVEDCNVSYDSISCY